MTVKVVFLNYALNGWMDQVHLRRVNKLTSQHIISQKVRTDSMTIHPYEYIVGIKQSSNQSVCIHYCRYVIVIATNQ